MTSVLRFIKQRPSDSQYFISIAGASPTLNIFFSDANSPTQSYVSGAAAGYFSTSTVGAAPTQVGNGITTPYTQIFRDMGVTIVSSLRTFRRVQLLQLDQGNAVINTTTGQVNNGLGVEWSAQGNPQNPGVVGSGVFTQGTSVEGVTGNQSISPYADTSFGVFYFETGANGLGLAQGLVRFG